MRLIGLLVYTQIILVGVILGHKATSHMIRKLGISSWKLIIYIRRYVVSNEKHPLLAQKLTQMKMVATGQGLKHPLANPSLYLHIWKEMSGTIERKLKVRHPKAWGMTR